MKIPLKYRVIISTVQAAAASKGVEGMKGEANRVDKQGGNLSTDYYALANAKCCTNGLFELFEFITVNSF